MAIYLVFIWDRSFLLSLVAMSLSINRRYERADIFWTARGYITIGAGGRAQGNHDVYRASLHRQRKFTQDKLKQFGFRNGHSNLR